MSLIEQAREYAVKSARKYARIGLVSLAMAGSVIGMGTIAAQCARQDTTCHTIADHPEERIEDLEDIVSEKPADTSTYHDNQHPEHLRDLLQTERATRFVEASPELIPEPPERTKVTKRMQLIDIIRYAMRENEVPPEKLPFILAVGKIESNFNPDCIADTTGAGGIFQQLGMREDFFADHVPSITDEFRLKIFNPALNKQGTRYLSLTNGHRKGARRAYAIQMIKMQRGLESERDSTIKVLSHWYRRGKINSAYFKAAEKAVRDQYWSEIAKQHSLFDPYIASLISTYTLYDSSRYYQSYRCYGGDPCVTFSADDAEVMATAEHHAGQGGVSSKLHRFKARNAKQYIEAARKGRARWDGRHSKYLGGFVKHRNNFRKLYQRDLLEPGAVKALFGRDTARNLFAEYEVEVWDI